MDISYNKLMDLPEDIYQLSNLTVIYYIFIFSLLLLLSSYLFKFNLFTFLFLLLFSQILSTKDNVWKPDVQPVIAKGLQSIMEHYRQQAAKKGKVKMIAIIIMIIQ